MKTEMLEAALAYLSRGWSVIPLCPPDHQGMSTGHINQCSNPGKTPFIKWQTYQKRLPREGEIRTWWEFCPSANVACVMGCVSGIVAIDVDGGDQGMELLQKISKGVGLKTLGFSTPGGGIRLLYQIPKGLIVKPRELVQGQGRVELLGEGKTTTMPPSIHKNGGRYG